MAALLPELRVRPGTAFEQLDKVGREQRLFHDAPAGVEAALARSARDRPVVVGKSLGTLAMAQLMLERRLPAGARTIWLTPLLQDQRVRSALEALDQPGLLVIGDQDPHFDPRFLERLPQHGVCQVLLLGARTTDLTSKAIFPEALVSWNGFWPRWSAS